MARLYLVKMVRTQHEEPYMQLEDDAQQVYCCTCFRPIVRASDWNACTQCHTRIHGDCSVGEHALNCCVECSWKSAE